MPEELLAVPPKAERTDAEASLWSVVAKNERVNRDWQELIRKAGTNAARCYDYLRATPLARQPGRIFPLRGKKYKGAWEYELTKGDRVFYLPYPKIRKVSVYYAGPHPPEAPIPPSL